MTRRSSPVTCPDCGWRGLPVAVRQPYDIEPVCRCPECCALLRVPRALRVASLEQALGVRLDTYRLAADAIDILDRIEGAVTDLVTVTLARDEHGVAIVRHPTRGTFRAGTFGEALTLMLAGGSHGA